MKYKEKSSVAKHLNRFQDLINQLAIKMMLDDELLLSSFLDNQKILVVSLNNSVSNNVEILGIVKDNILNEKTKRREYGVTAQTEVLTAKIKERSKTRNS